MSASFSNQVLAQIELFAQRRELRARRVHAAQAARRDGGPPPPRRARREADQAHPPSRPTTSASPSTAPTSPTTTATERAGSRRLVRRDPPPTLAWAETADVRLRPMGDELAWRRTFWLRLRVDAGQLHRPGPALPGAAALPDRRARHVQGRGRPRGVGHGRRRPRGRGRGRAPSVDRRGRRPLLVVGTDPGRHHRRRAAACTSVPAVLRCGWSRAPGRHHLQRGGRRGRRRRRPRTSAARYLALFSLFFYVGFAVGPFVAEMLIERTGFAGRVVDGGRVQPASGAVPAWPCPRPGTPRPRRPSRCRGATRMFHPAARRPGHGVLLHRRRAGRRSRPSCRSTPGTSACRAPTGCSSRSSITVLATRFFAGGLADRFGRVAGGRCRRVLLVPWRASSARPLAHPGGRGASAWWCSAPASRACSPRC